MNVNTQYTILGEKANYYHYMHRKNKDRYQNIALSHRNCAFFAQECSTPTKFIWPNVLLIVFGSRCERYR